MKLTATLLAPLFAFAIGCGEAPAPAPDTSAGGVDETAEASQNPLTAGLPKVGDAMPAYSAVALDGRKFDNESLAGKVSLLNIWATWCGPCRHEIPELIALQKELGDQGFEVVGVSIDDANSVEKVRQFAADQGINYPVVLDPRARIAELFQTTVIPTSALVDREGKIRWIHIGVVRGDDPSLKEAIEKSL